MISLQPFMLDEYRIRREGMKTISAAVALSILVHIAVLWWQPRIRFPVSEIGKPSDTIGSLSVQLAPRVSPPRAPPSVPSVQAQRPIPRPAPRPKVASRPRPKAPVLALNKPAPERTAPAPAPVPTPPPVAAPTPAPPRAQGDLSSYIEARRRARGESPAAAAPAPPAPSSTRATPDEDENTRANRIAAANLGLDRKPTFGPDPTPGGGIFSLRYLSEDYAEFLFFGWNKDIRRNTTQLIEVRKGSNSNIRVAVVLKMIAIIREHEQGDFVWQSTRLGRNVVLSARARDTAGLQDFLMAEFFDEINRSR
jgi:hypothetical protein